MTLSKFPVLMPKAMAAVIDAGEALRYLRDTRGDLRLADLDRVQDALRTAKTACVAAYSDATGATDPVRLAAEKMMADFGGPADMAAFAAGMQQIEVAAAAWNAHWAGWLNTLSAANFVAPITRTENGISTTHVARTFACDEAAAAPLRQSAELSALIDAFAAVGA